MACDLYYYGSSVKDNFKRVPEDFYDMKAGDDQGLNLGVAVVSKNVKKTFDRIWLQINCEARG